MSIKTSSDPDFYSNISNYNPSTTLIWSTENRGQPLTEEQLALRIPLFEGMTEISLNPPSEITTQLVVKQELFSHTVLKTYSLITKALYNFFER